MPSEEKDLLFFKKGKSIDLPNISHTPGAVYFTTDDGLLYIDYKETDGNGNTQNIRKPINSTKTAYIATATNTNTYFKIYDFGNWGSGAWYQKNFSMLITSRAGETVWVTLAANDSNTTARAIRLMNTYSKINKIYYNASESAIYVQAIAWANNICAHIITNINGNYIPKVTQVSSLPNTASEIKIIEFGASSNGTNIGSHDYDLNLKGQQERLVYSHPTADGSAIINESIAYLSDMDNNGNLILEPEDGEGGQIQLLTSKTDFTNNGILLDTANGNFRIIGLESKDHTSKVGYGTVLNIDPYSATILGEGRYYFDGTSEKAKYPAGFNANGGDITWGTLKGDTTTTTGYKTIARWDSQNGGSVAFAEGPMNNETKKAQASMQIDGYYYQDEGAYQVLDTRNINGTTAYIPKFTSTNTINNSHIIENSNNDVTIGGKLIVNSVGSTSSNSYNEGIRILPASNGWSELFFSNTTDIDGTHPGGWILGKRGSEGNIGAVNDFTIECNGSNGNYGLTIHQNGNATLSGNIFKIADKVALTYNSNTESLDFIFN